MSSLLGAQWAAIRAYVGRGAHSGRGSQDCERRPGGLLNPPLNPHIWLHAACPSVRGLNWLASHPEYSHALVKQPEISFRQHPAH
jgi:hypothetical protein